MLAQSTIDAQPADAAPAAGAATATLPASLAPEELSAWRGFLAAHSTLMRALDRELSERHGLALAEYDVLLALAQAGERRLRMAELADAVLLTRSGLTRLVERLERAGLVDRRRCPSDARGIHAELTAAGLGRLREAAPTHLAAVRVRFIDRLHAEDLARLSDAFARLGAASDGPPCGPDPA